MNSSVHDPQSIKCSQCVYTTRRQFDLDKHIVIKHDDKVCGIGECLYKTKLNNDLKRHQTHIHDIKVVWSYCTETGCLYKTKSNGNLKKHLANKHDSNVVWFNCTEIGCVFKTKQKSHLKTHLANKHDLNVIWFNCIEPGCVFKAKDKGALKRHHAYIHDLNVVWFKCIETGCNYKTKGNGNLKSHLANIHDLNVIWVNCTETGCDFKCKQSNILKAHLEFVHDIGSHKCEVCLVNRNTHIKLDNAFMCRRCYKKATGFTSRIEHQISDYVDKNFGTEYLTSSDKSLKSLNGCQLYRPDKMYVSDDLVLIIEVDEHAHKYNNGDYSCDEKRILDIYHEPGIIGKRMVAIRINPDKYCAGNATKMVRMESLVSLMKKVVKEPSQDMIHIYYMYYDADSPRLSKNINHTLLY